MNASSVGDIVFGAIVIAIAVALIVNYGLTRRAEIRAEADAKASLTESRKILADLNTRLDRLTERLDRFDR